MGFKIGDLVRVRYGAQDIVADYWGYKAVVSEIDGSNLRLNWGDSDNYKYPAEDFILDEPSVVDKILEKYQSI